MRRDRRSDRVAMHCNLPGYNPRMLTAIGLGLHLMVGGAFSFHTETPYDPAVPKPSDVLGYEIGSKHTVFMDQVRVTTAIQNSSPTRIKRISYGKSTEGRPLRVYAISTPENIARLDQIQADLNTLANPKPGDDIAAIQKRTPVLVWVNQCIHGDETASYESGMELIYNLVASRSPRISKMLQNALVIVNPVYNPDGHERYVVAYNSIPQGNPEPEGYDGAIPRAFFGRANHYRFDMNRDRVSMSQAETRQEVALFLQWNPHVYVDQHGHVDTYFFPPVQQSVNSNVDRDRYNKWTEIFGRKTGAAFDKEGWTYFIRQDYDLYNACYLDSHTSLMGAIGMTHETDGGREMSSRREDDTILTLRDGMEKHFVSALAVIESATEHREELLKSYSDFKQKAVSGKHAGKMQRVILSSDDPRELKRLADHLGRMGIVSKFAALNWTQKKAYDYWSTTTGKQEFKAGSLVIDLAQSQGPVAKAMLESGSDFEPEFIQRQLNLAKNRKAEKRDPELDSFEFYDSTGWALPYAYNLRAWWCEDTPAITTREYSWTVASPANSTVGYYLPYSDQADILFAAKVMGTGIKVAMTTKLFGVGGDQIPVGSFLFRAARNEKGYEEKLKAMAMEIGVQLKPLKTSFPDAGRNGPGSENVLSLKKPKIGLAFGNAGTIAGGALWYLFEQDFKIPFFSLTNSSLEGDLSTYTSIVIPGGSGFRLSEKLREWVENGGTLIALENPNWAIGDKSFIKLDSVSSEPDLPGALFRADLDPLSPLSFGYTRTADPNVKIQVAVPIEGGQFYKAPKSGSDIALSAEKDFKKLLSGWIWPDTEKEIAGTYWLHTADAGAGRVILFSNDPTSRAQWPGLHKLLLNAMIVSPSL